MTIARVYETKVCPEKVTDMEPKTVAEGFRKMANDIKETIRDVRASAEIEDPDGVMVATPLESELLTTMEELCPIRCESFNERGSVAQLSALYGALADAKGTFPPIKKTKHVKIKLKDNKGEYDFDYAPLDEMIECCTPSLSRCGLAVIFPFGSVQDGALVKQRVLLTHKSGARLEGQFSWPPASDMKVFGGETTYVQRYSYRSILGISADSDLDDMPVTMGRAEGSAQGGYREKSGYGGQQSQQRPQQNTQNDNRAQGQAKNTSTRHAPGPTQTDSTPNRPASTPAAANGPTGAGTADRAGFTRGEAADIARDHSTPSQATSGNEKSSASPASTGATTADGKASTQSCVEMLAKLKDMGYNSATLAANRIFKANGGDVIKIGKEPFGREMTQAQVDMVMQDLVTEAVDKALVK